ncbi:hypothetical protein [Streptomyces roseochromogenus]|uniref:Integral membrane protein n=1 Tax=Streptomyces roseochromogenus subsp. oscitans DS 12.976 TaxID=1352936 RepID=V6K544_STRRC|nr:hypothetical protein [Streptomyces roseochromogenus]EST26536.1 hypothetical protein M878_27150 [Streptomyces roseochromogenus subsp. oscitans DS 12.976]
MSALDSRDTDLRKELDATLQTRRELGEEYEPALVDSFLEKVEQRIDDTVDRRVRRHLAEQQMASARGTRRPKDADTWPERFGFAIISLVLAIPLTAVGGGIAGTAGTIATWVGIVGVNFAQAARLNPELLAGRRGRSREDG